MARRLVVLVVLAVGLTFSATAGADHSGRIASLRARAAAARQREAVLNAQIANTTRQIRTLERTIGDVAQRVAILEHDLQLHRRRLARLNAPIRPLRTAKEVVP